MAIKWGTPDKVRFIDPLTSVPLEIGASGELNLQVSDARKLLLKLVGTANGMTQEQLVGAGSGKGMFRAMVMTQVKSYLAQAIREMAGK